MCQFGIPFVVCVLLVSICSSQKTVGYVRYRRNTLLTIGAKTLNKLLQYATPLHQVHSKRRWDVSYVKAGALTAAKKDWYRIPADFQELLAISKNGQPFKAQGKVVGDRFFRLTEEAVDGYPPQITIYKITSANGLPKLVEPVHIKYLPTKGTRLFSNGD